MEEDNKLNNDLIKLSTDSLDISNNELLDKILKVDSKEELEELYYRLEINNTKKNAFRVNELNKLLDLVNKQAAERFTKRPGEISNKEVLDYMNAIQNQIDRSEKTVANINQLNTTQINNQINNINISLDNNNEATLNKNSRDRILKVIDLILKENKSQEPVDIDISDSSEDTSPVEPVDINEKDLDLLLDDDFEGDN